MKRLKMAARFIAVLCYFAPFETCNFPSSSTEVSSYDSVIKMDQRFADTSRIIDSLKNITATDSVTADSIKTRQTSKVKNSFWDRLYSKIMYPTDDSISGIAAIIFFEDKTGSISLGLSFLLSVFLLFSWKFLRIKKRRQFLLLVNFLCILIFIVDATTRKNTELRWGVWCLASIVIFQLFLEYYDQKRIGIQVQTEENKT